MRKGKRVPSLIDEALVDKLYTEDTLYTKFGDYEKKLHGFEVFKVPLNADFTCPNWDGRLSKDGCLYCPDFARQFTYESFRRVINQDLKDQLNDQIKYYKKKGAGEKALVYIAFGTNTYAPLKELKKIFDTALRHKDVIGLSIGTRPDCLPDEVLDLLGEYVKQGKEIWLELGQQSVHYHTAERVNRQHGFGECIRVVTEAHKRGIYCMMFLIMGLPYETPQEMMESARVVSALGLDAIKLYPLLVMKKTRLSNEYKKGTYRPISRLEYIRILADFLEFLSPYVLIQRLSKDCGLDGKIAPEWNTHRFLVGPAVEKTLMIRGAIQGTRHKLTLDMEELVPLTYKK